MGQRKKYQLFGIPRPGLLLWISHSAPMSFTFLRCPMGIVTPACLLHKVVSRNKADEYMEEL